jgi:broad specificity phosphatase PhoE
MKNFIYAALILLTCSCNNTKGQTNDNEESSEITTLYFIRHAEKDLTSGADPTLTDKGERRAEQWINYFFLKDIDHVLSSDFNRTQSTAAPLAASKKLEVELYDVAALTGKEIYDKYQGKTVVLYGHSNTIGNYANDLQKDEVFKDLDESDYDHFYIVRIDKNGNASATIEAMDFME